MKKLNLVNEPGIEPEEASVANSSQKFTKINTEANRIADLNSQQITSIEMDILKLEERTKLLKGDKQKCKMRIVNICLEMLKNPEISV